MSWPLSNWIVPVLCGTGSNTDSLVFDFELDPTWVESIQEASKFAAKDPRVRFVDLDCENNLVWSDDEVEIGVLSLRVSEHAVLIAGEEESGESIGMSFDVPVSDFLAFLQSGDRSRVDGCEIFPDLTDIMAERADKIAVEEDALSLVVLGPRANEQKAENEPGITL